MTYQRRPGQAQIDLQNAKAFEDEVQSHLPGITIARTTSTTELDFFIPHVYVEVKEKRQVLTDRWTSKPALALMDEADLFVVDELTVRKALKHYPFAWFVLRSIPGEWIRVANICEIVSADRVRFDRNGKGKWVVDTSYFLDRRLDSILRHIQDDIQDAMWNMSGCVITAPEV